MFDLRGKNQSELGLISASDDRSIEVTELRRDARHGLWTEGVKLYGPFTSVYSLKEAVTHLQKAFKFRTCHLDIRDDDDNRQLRGDPAR